MIFLILLLIVLLSCLCLLFDIDAKIRCRRYQRGGTRYTTESRRQWQWDTTMGRGEGGVDARINNTANGRHDTHRRWCVRVCVAIVGRAQCSRRVERINSGDELVVRRETADQHDQREGCDRTRECVLCVRVVLSPRVWCLFFFLFVFSFCVFPFVESPMAVGGCSGWSVNRRKDNKQTKGNNKGKRKQRRNNRHTNKGSNRTDQA